MGIKKISENIWKIICSAFFTVVFIIGVCMCLSAYGVIDKNAFGGAEHLETQKFISYLVMIFGLFLGVLPFLKIFRTLVKFAFSILGIVLFVYGVCITLDAYNVCTIQWASTNSGDVTGPILLVLGLFTGVIPFIKTWKKLFCEDKPNIGQ